MQQIKESVTLDVEHQVKFSRMLIWQGVASLDTSSMQQHIDAAAVLTHLVDDLGDCFRIRQVDTGIMWRAARRTHGIDGGLGSLCSLQAGEFFFDESWSGAFTASLYARKQVAF